MVVIHCCRSMYLLMRMNASVDTGLCIWMLYVLDVLLVAFCYTDDIIILKCNWWLFCGATVEYRYLSLSRLSSGQATTSQSGSQSVS